MIDTTRIFPAAEFTGVTIGDRPKWLSIRRTMMTASKTAALFGEHPFTTPLELYADMVTERHAEQVVDIASPMFWGTALEQAIFQAAAGYYGWKAVPGGHLLRSRKHPHLGATLDGAVDLGPGWDVYEGKTTSAWRARDWNEDEGKAPRHVIIQAQHQLLVTGAERALVFCLIGGQKPAKVIIEASPKFHAALVEETEAFMDLVSRLEPPQPTGAPSDKKALRRLFPADDGSVVALPAEALDWTRQYQEVSAELKRLERRKAHLAELLQHSIGSATYGVLPEPVGGKSCWRWALQAREAYEVEAGESRVLIQLKDAPVEPERFAALPRAANTNSLVDAMERSLDDGNAAPIRMPTKRKRARR